MNPTGDTNINNPDCLGTEEDDVGTSEERKFCVQLTGESDLQSQLDLFKEACLDNDVISKKKRKRRYYHLGLMAHVNRDTKDEEIRPLLVHGTRTFEIDGVVNKQEEVKELFDRLQRKIGDYQLENPKIKVVTGYALEIHNDALRIGRMRNNCPGIISVDDLLTLTFDESYRYSSYKEIAFVMNLKYYFKDLKVNDLIKIGNDLEGRIVKKLPNNIVLLMLVSGVFHSYDYLTIPDQCALDPKYFPKFFDEDIRFAEQMGFHYVVLKKIRCKPFLGALRARLEETKLELIGSIDVEFVSEKMYDLMGMMRMLDYIWMPDWFHLEQNLHDYLYNDIVPLAKCLKKPIIASVPIERCSDFKGFESREFLQKADAIYIEKSPWCHKYPLIVKKLLPILDYRITQFEQSWGIKEMLPSYQSITNFVIRAINSINTTMVILDTQCRNAALSFGRSEIYTNVYIPIPVQLDETEATLEKKIEFARAMNLRRNLKPIIYSYDLNSCHYKPVEFMMNYLRDLNCISTGDFIITIECVERGPDANTLCASGDLVFLRAFYLPPHKGCEKFLYT